MLGLGCACGWASCGPSNDKHDSQEWVEALYEKTELTLVKSVRLTLTLFLWEILRHAQLFCYVFLGWIFLVKGGEGAGRASKEGWLLHARRFLSPSNAHVYSLYLHEWYLIFQDRRAEPDGRRVG